ncbi:MAG: M48 family metallopeptidase [Patescibacteria group bacterium]
MNTIFTFPKFLTRYRIVRRRRFLGRRQTLKSRPASLKLRRTRKNYIEHKETARGIVHAKLAEHNEHYGFKWGRVAIKNMKSRWGSCSAKGNLNFHFRVAALPAELLDYVIVHEICHLKEMNHGKEFWDLVAERIPDHKQRRKALGSVSLR